MAQTYGIQNTYVEGNYPSDMRKPSKELDEEGYLKVLVATLKNQGTEAVSEQEMMGMVSQMGMMKNNHKLAEAIQRLVEFQEDSMSVDSLRKATMQKGERVIALPKSKEVQKAKEDAIDMSRRKGLTHAACEEAGKRAESLAKMPISGIVQNARRENGVVMVDLLQEDNQVIKVPYANISEYKGQTDGKNDLSMSVGNTGATSVVSGIVDQVKNLAVGALLSPVKSLVGL